MDKQPIFNCATYRQREENRLYGNRGVKKKRQPCMSLKGVAEMLSEGTIMGSS